MTQIPIYTIGYGARDIDGFIAVLKAHDIAYLIDVRSKPYSRYKPDFSKDALEGYLQAQGIRYIFMGDTLGGQPGDPDCYVDGKVEYDLVKQKPFYLEGIGRLRQAQRQQLHVAIMCSEGKPEQCHRSKLIGITLTAESIEVAHIDENDQLISQEDVNLRLDRGQLRLLDDSYFNFRSRKRYQSEEEDETGGA